MENYAADHVVVFTSHEIDCFSFPELVKSLNAIEMNSRELNAGSVMSFDQERCCLDIFSRINQLSGECEFDDKNLPATIQNLCQHSHALLSYFQSEPGSSSPLASFYRPQSDEHPRVQALGDGKSSSSSPQNNLANLRASFPDWLENNSDTRTPVQILLDQMLLELDPSGELDPKQLIRSFEVQRVGNLLSSDEPLSVALLEAAAAEEDDEIEEEKEGDKKGPWRMDFFRSPSAPRAVWQKEEEDAACQQVRFIVKTLIRKMKEKEVQLEDSQTKILQLEEQVEVLTKQNARLKSESAQSKAE